MFDLSATLIGLFTTTCIYLGYNLLFHPLRNIPGPLRVRLGLSSWRLERAIKCDYRWKLDQLHQKYGTVVRTGSNEISLSSVEDSKKVYNGTWTFPKSSFYLGFFDGKNENSFETSNAKVHAKLKKLYYPAFNPSSVKIYENGINTIMHRFADDLRSFSQKNNGTINMSEMVSRLTVDFIGQVGFSTRFEEKVVNKLLEVSDTVLKSCTFIGTQPFVLPPIARFVGRLVGNPMEVTQNASKETFDKFRLSNDEDQENVITRTVRAAEARNEELTEKKIGMAGSGFLGAGLDTTNAVIQSILSRLISLDDDAARRLQNELGSITIENVSTIDDLRNASPFAFGILQETFRLDTPSSWLLSRIIKNEQGIMVGNGKYHLPFNTDVGSSTWIVHRDEKYWGNDARQFKPERWLEEAKGKESWLLTFGNAPRMCPGQHLATTFLCKFLVLIFTQFTIQKGENLENLLEQPIDPESGKNDIRSPFIIQSQWLSRITKFYCKVLPK